MGPYSGRHHAGVTLELVPAVRRHEQRDTDIVNSITKPRRYFLRWDSEVVEHQTCLRKSLMVSGDSTMSTRYR